MNLGAVQFGLLQPSPKVGQGTALLREQEQQKGLRLAEERVTLSGGSRAPSPTYAHPGRTRKEPEQSLTEIAWDNLLAQRIGLSKEKLDQLKQKKKEVAEDPTLSDEEKQKLLEDLDRQREELIQEAAERRQQRGDEERQSNPEPGNPP
ncbi:hypothetical protein ACL00X_14470 [Aeromonas diversa]|uniref:hypothetical protein n=1 Tax=Aeromonas diversa TaxID=502790 RepID=UPI0039A28FFF